MLYQPNFPAHSLSCVGHFILSNQFNLWPNGGCGKNGTLCCLAFTRRLGTQLTYKWYSYFTLWKPTRLWGRMTVIKGLHRLGATTSLSFRQGSKLVQPSAVDDIVWITMCIAYSVIPNFWKLRHLHSSITCQFLRLHWSIALLSGNTKVSWLHSRSTVSLMTGPHEYIATHIHCGETIVSTLNVTR